MDIPVGYGQATLIFTGSNLPEGAAVTIGLEISGWGSSPTVAAGAIAADWAESNLGTSLGVGCNMTSVLVKFGPNETGPSGVFATTLDPGQGVPVNNPGTCILVHKRTAFGGRSGRGRMYLPLPQDLGVNENGTLTTTYLTNLQSQVDAFANALENDALNPVLLHNPGAPLSVPTPITDWVVDSRIATQRRRNRR